MARHLWIMGKLLTLKEPFTEDRVKNLNHRILCYVIATCYPKIIHRLRNKTYSIPFIMSLKKIETFQFDESKLNLDQVSQAEIDNDAQFVTHFLLPCVKVFNASIPNLIEQAKQVEQAKVEQAKKKNAPKQVELADKKNASILLYTKDTCLEFHKLLVELLERFVSSLERLEKTRGKEEVSTPASDEFKTAVGLAMTSGCALQRLTKGAALKMHLTTIAHLLVSFIRRKPLSDEEQEEFDEDLKAVQPFITITIGSTSTPRLLPMSYIDWLRLMLAHFDAVNILVGFFTAPGSQFDNIPIQVLVAPPEDQRLLPWEHLFHDSSLFPTDSVGLDPHYAKPNSDVTNLELLKFLKTALDPSTKVKSLKTTWKNNDYKATASILNSLTDCNVLGWSNHAKQLLQKLQPLGIQEGGSGKGKKKMIFVEECSANKTEYGAFSEGLQLLWESARFFAYLADDGKRFFGTLHCEATLASLLGGTPTVGKDLLALMNVGYIPNLFLSSVSFLVKGLWISYWNIKTLLPNLSTSNIPPRGKQRSAIHHKRLSQYCHRLHSAYMASSAYRGFNEHVFWRPVEAGAS